jgi:hypothetical protein
MVLLNDIGIAVCVAKKSLDGSATSEVMGSSPVGSAITM